MKNNYNGCCSCHTGNPPCSFCTDTFICDCCGNRDDVHDDMETDLGFVCLNCQEENKMAICYSGLRILGKMNNHKYAVYIGGKLSINISNIKLPEGISISDPLKVIPKQP